LKVLILKDINQKHYYRKASIKNTTTEKYQSKVSVL